MKFDIARAMGLKKETKAESLAGFIIRYWWLWLLIAITVFSFWSRMIPAKYGELQALDPFYAYRINMYMLNHNLQIPQYDYMRYWPDGIGIERYGPLMYFYVPVYVYTLFSALGMSMTYLDFAIMYPALMGALSVFIIFWLADAIFRDKKAGLFAAFFLATVPGYIARTSAGFFDKEATGGTFMLLSLAIMMIAYNRNSLKIGLLSTVTTFIAVGSWGGAQFIAYVVGMFVIFKLLINKYDDRLLKSTVPVLIFVYLTQVFFLHLRFTFEQMLSLTVVAFLSIRYAAGRYKLVKNENMPYLIPGLMVLLVMVLLVGSLFNDTLWDIVNHAISLVVIPEKGYMGTTVAEQQPGTWNDITSRTSVFYSRNVLPLGPVEPLASIWLLFIFGAIAAVYEIYTTRKWVLIFPLFWLLMSLQTIFYMVRLVFFLGPPAAIMAGYFMAFITNRIVKNDVLNKKFKFGNINAVMIILVIFIAVVLLSNAVTGYVFCSSVGPSYNQYWDEAMNYMKTQTPVNSSILSWWDFGYWFQAKGERPSIADGGNNNGTVDDQIAEWFVTDARNWTQYRWWLKSKDVKYILMDYTLPGKYGAISKIASKGKTITGMLQMQQTATYPQANKTIIEYSAGQYTVWIPVGESGNIAGAPMFMLKRGGQYLGKNYITDICTPSGIIRINVSGNQNVMTGCLAIAPFGLFYIPPEAEYSIFTNLMFMDGYGIPDVQKVFDNKLIKIYKLEINESVS